MIPPHAEPRVTATDDPRLCVLEAPEPPKPAPLLSPARAGRVYRVRLYCWRPARRG